MALIADIGNIDPPSNDDIVALKQAGIDGVIIGLQYPTDPQYHVGTAHLWIPAILASDIKLIGCYAESQPISTTWANVEQWKAQIPQVFQACEETFVTRDYIDTGLNFIDALNLGTRGGIYTGAWWWNAQADNIKHWFGDRDLWAAQYDNEFDLSFAQIGDWTQCKYKQVVGNAKIGRLAVDLSVSPRW